MTQGTLVWPLGILVTAVLSGVASGQSAFQTTGPYKVVMEATPSLPNHSVYRPENLAAVKGDLRVVAVGNGACANAGNAFENYLSEISSYGFLVVANGPINPSAPGRPPRPGAAPPALPETAAPEAAKGQAPRAAFEQSKTSQLFETMDWAKSQNED